MEQETRSTAERDTARPGRQDERYTNDSKSQSSSGQKKLFLQWEIRIMFFICLIHEYAWSEVWKESSTLYPPNSTPPQHTHTHFSSILFSGELGRELISRQSFHLTAINYQWKISARMTLSIKEYLYCGFRFLPGNSSTDLNILIWCLRGYYMPSSGRGQGSKEAVHGAVPN